MRTNQFVKTLTLYFIIQLWSGTAILASTTTTIPVKDLKSRLSTLFKSTKRPWRRVYRHSTATEYTVSYVPRQQSLSNWKQMIQFQISPVASFKQAPYQQTKSKNAPNTQTLLTLYQKTLKKHCKKSIWRTLHSQANHSAFEYNINHCGAWGNQYKVEKLIQRNGQFQSLRYIDRSPITEQTKKQYSTLITNFKW